MTEISQAINCLDYDKLFTLEQSQRKTEKIMKIKKDSGKLDYLFNEFSYQDCLPETLKQEIEMLNFWLTKKETERTFIYDEIIEQTRLFIEFMQNDLK